MKPFYGLILDQEQRAFVDAIMDQSKTIVFCNAKAGTGRPPWRWVLQTFW